jgi:hypothetical protein
VQHRKDSFIRAIGATLEALIAAFCRLDKSLSYCWEKGWLVGAVGIEPTSLMGSAGPELTAKGTNSLESQTFSELQARSKPGVEPSFIPINRLLTGGS